MVHPALVGGIVAGAALAAVLAYMYLENRLSGSPYHTVPEEIDMDFSESEPEDDDALDRFAKRMGLRRRRGRRPLYDENEAMQEKFFNVDIAEQDAFPIVLERERMSYEAQKRGLDARRSSLFGSEPFFKADGAALSGSHFVVTEDFVTPSMVYLGARESEPDPDSLHAEEFVAIEDPLPSPSPSPSPAVENDQDPFELHPATLPLNDARFELRDHLAVDLIPEASPSTSSSPFYYRPDPFDDAWIADEPSVASSAYESIPSPAPLEDEDSGWATPISESMANSVSLAPESLVGSLVTLSETMSDSVADLSDSLDGSVTIVEDATPPSAELLLPVLNVDTSDRLMAGSRVDSARSEDSWSDVDGES